MSSLAKELKAIQRENYKAKIEAIVEQHKISNGESVVNSVSKQPATQSIFAFGFENLQDTTKTVAKRKRRKGKKSVNDTNEVDEGDDVEGDDVDAVVPVHTATPVATNEPNNKIPTVQTAPVIKPKAEAVVPKKNESNTIAEVTKPTKNIPEPKSKPKSKASDKKSATKAAVDDDMDFLNQTLKQLEVDNLERERKLKEELELQKASKKALKKTNKQAGGVAAPVMPSTKDTSTSAISKHANSNNNNCNSNRNLPAGVKAPKLQFNSPNDPSLSSKMKLKVKYGDGKNIVALSKVPKVRDHNWVLGGLVDDISPPTGVAVSEVMDKHGTNDTVTSSTITTSTTTSSSNPTANQEYVTHTSPFSFGFQLRN